MIKVTEKAMTEICHKLSIDEKELNFIGGGREDSDGSVYTYNSSSGKMVLKILAIPKDQTHKLSLLETRVRYANYLEESNSDIGYKNELSFFMNWCKNPIVKSAWAEMEGYLDALPKGQNEILYKRGNYYGLQNSIE